MRGHTPSQPTCWKLKEAGFPQNTEFSWNNKWIGLTVAVTRPFTDMCAAPIHTEILKEIPLTKIDNKTGFAYYLTTMRATKRGQWLVGYFHPFQPPELASWLLCVKNDSLLEATAELYLLVRGGT